MDKAIPFGDVLEAVDKLSSQDQEALIEVVRQRLIERRREELARDIRRAEREFRSGRCRPVTVAELMKEILS